jgi:predicted nucleotidyltransferase
MTEGGSMESVKLTVRLPKRDLEAPNLHAPGDLTRDMVLHRLREVYPELKTQFGVRQLGLFGSFASATANEASDVDLIVDFERPIGLRFVELVEYLETLLGRKVDLLTAAGLRGIRLPVVAQRIEESVIHAGEGLLGLSAAR